MEVYEIIKSIGSGSFGQVYMVKHKLEEKNYVVKKIKTRDMQQKDRESTEQEVRLLQKLRHTNIVAYKDSYLDQDQFLNIVMIYCEGGDMYNKIRNSKGKNFPETQILDWFAQMALALYYLHDKKILHRDLKTQNIFLKHGRVRLGDFGIAKVLDSTRDFANTCIGTPYYMSPELFKYKPYSYKSDIWALGCVMYEICNLRHAFDAQSFQGLAVKIIKGSYPPITPTYSKQLRDLIGKMLCLNPKDRPTIIDILNKPIIKRRVVNYMTEIFTGKYPEASLPNDVDDIYVDSLREQAEALGITHYVQESIARGEVPDKVFENLGDDSGREASTDKKDNHGLKSIQNQVKENKKALKKAVEEKENIEKELERLEKKEKALPRGSKNRNHSQEKIKKIPISRADNGKEKNGDELSSNREPKRGNDDNKFKSKDTKHTAIKTETSADEKPLKLRQKEGAQKEQKVKKNQGMQRDSVHEEEEKSKEKQNLNPRKYSAENAPSMEEIGDEDYSEHGDKKGFVDKRQQVLYEKEKKRREEQDQKERELQAIRMNNIDVMKKASEKRQAQYRPSNDMYSALKIGESKDANGKGGEQNNSTTSGFGNLNERETLNSVESRDSIKVEDGLKHANNEIFEGKVRHSGTFQKKKFKIEEEYGMNDEMTDDEEEEKVILEEDEEDEEGEGNGIKKRIEVIKNQLQEKTMKINELKQTIKKTVLLEKTVIKTGKMHKNDQQEDAKVTTEENELEDYSDIFDDNDFGEEYDSTEETTNAPESEAPEKKSFHPQYYKIQDRIKLLKYRCEAGIGNTLYEKSYKYLIEKANSASQEEIRKHLIDILGEENIGFWHLIDQILLFEGFAKRFHEAN